MSLPKLSDIIGTALNLIQYMVNCSGELRCWKECVCVCGWITGLHTWNTALVRQSYFNTKAQGFIFFSLSFAVIFSPSFFTESGDSTVWLARTVNACSSFRNAKLFSRGLVPHHSPTSNVLWTTPLSTKVRRIPGPRCQTVELQGVCSSICYFPP